jgi:uncharacterized damage-inducible protein DinB
MLTKVRFIGFSKFYSTSTLLRHSSSTPRSSDDKLIIHQALTVLHQQEYVLDLIKKEDYSQKVPQIFNSAIGGHLRHILDHYNALLKAATTTERFANYDDRSRNTAIETDPEAARAAIKELFKKIPDLNMQMLIHVSFIGDDKTFEAYKVKSTVERELSFVAHHAVHHLSMIKLLLAALGYQLPADSRLGIAFSTAKEMQK